MALPRVRAVTSRALYAQVHGTTNTISTSAARGAAAALQLPLNDGKLPFPSWLLTAAMGTAVAAATVAQSDDSNATRCEQAVKLASVLPSVGAPTSGGVADSINVASSSSSLVSDDTPSAAKRGGRRNLLKSRTRHKAKLEEVDLMKIHLDEYKKARAAFDSPLSRFQLYATKTIAIPKEPSSTPVPAMSFTDFVHSLILPRFHTRLPHPDVEYSCEFVGNADGLITYEECYLLNHLLMIPKEHFDVAFCMFDLDGDGAVDKNEFCHVIENLLAAISTKERESLPQLLELSAETAMPKLIKFLFGQYGKKTIRASQLDAALDELRKQILHAEFALYAKPHPKKKGIQVISVHDFAITLLSCFDADRLPPYLERVQKLNASDELVSWDDFYNFHFHVQSHLADIKLAFELTGAEEITEADFIHAAHVVTGVELPFPVVQLAFRVFDGNENGTLDRAELMKVLEMRTTMDLQRPHADTKFQRFWQCVTGPAE